MPKRTVAVPKIACPHCVQTIEQQLGELSGVAAVQADAAAKQVTVEWNEPTVGWSAIASRLAAIGYPAEDA